MLVPLWIILYYAVINIVYSTPYLRSNSSVAAKNRQKSSMASGNVIQDATWNEQKTKKKAQKQQVISPYSEGDNIVKRISQTWGEFSSSSHKTPLTKPYIKSSALKALQQCSAPNAVPTCKEAISDEFITAWKSRKVSGLCEENAVSKISCFDSVGKSRMCVFENAMMDFHKTRKKKVDGHLTRSWERGFLSADCGDLAPDDINYLQLYKPDIEGREEARCDFAFHEPVLAYSHENARNFGQVSSDYLNVWAMLSVAGISHISKDVTFLNIDGIRRGKYFGDQLNQYFRTYNATFRRIIKAADFADVRAKVCFKKLIMPPRPTLNFHADIVSAVSAVGAGAVTGTALGAAASQSQQCAAGREAVGLGDAVDAVHSHVLGISSLFQRWNLQVRQNYGLLHLDALPSHDGMQILLITRTPPPNGPNTTHILSRMFTNTDQLVTALNGLVGEENHHYPTRIAKLVVADFTSIGFEQQVRLMASSSVAVGMHGAGIASSMHMAVGTRYCCGVVEIFPEGEFRSVKGYRNLARRMGHHYARMEVAPEHTSLQGTTVPVTSLVQAVRGVVDRITTSGGSCFLPEVLSSPYL